MTRIVLGAGGPTIGVTAGTNAETVPTTREVALMSLPGSVQGRRLHHTTVGLAAGATQARSSIPWSILACTKSKT